MRKPLRIAIVGSTFALVTAGCGLIGTDKESSKEKADNSSDSSASGTVNDRQFSLSLPELPDNPEMKNYKAHLRIYRGEAPVAMEDCGSPGDPGIPDKPSEPPMKEPDRPMEPPLPKEPDQEDKEFQLYSQKEPYGIAYEDSVPYVPGTTLGPVLLDRGAYTAILDVYDSGNRTYSGHAWFKVGQGIQEIRMKMMRVGDCGGGQGGVIIKPVLPNEKDQVSACKFLDHMKFPPDACLPEKATCYYRDIKGPSNCSVHMAKYGLIKQLCSKDMMVSRAKFLSEIMCESSTLPPIEPPMPPQEPPTKPPMPPSDEARSCQELNKPCDNSPAKYCVAYFKDPAGGGEKKSYSGTGDKCNDRKVVLKELCSLKVQNYEFFCK